MGAERIPPPETPTAGETRAGSGVAQAAVLIVVLTAVSRLLGFVRETVFAGIFGAGADFDAFLVAQGLPNIAVSLISTAVVTASIPLLSGYAAREEDKRLDRTFNTILTVVLALLVVAAALLAAFAEPLTRLAAPGFSDEQTELAARLARILLLASVLVAAMNLFAGLLQAHRRFLWPALVGVPFNVVMIAAAAVFGGEFGVVAIAIGFVVASASRVATEIPGLRAIGYRPAFRLDLRDPGVRTVLALAPLVLVGQAAGNVNTVVDRIVGSTQEPGTISALNYGFRVVSLPYALLTLALVQAIYPAIGAAASAVDRIRLHSLLTRGLTTMAAILLPVSAALLVLRVPVVELIFGRGNFDGEDVSLTATAVALYGIGLVFLSWRELVSRGFYAQGDARTPVMAAVIGMAVNVIGDVTLGQALGIGGLALSTSLSFAAGFGILIARFDRRFGAGIGRELAPVALRLLLASSGAGAAMLAAYELLGAPSPMEVAAFPLLKTLALIAVPGGVGALAYLALMRVFAADELRQLRGALATAIARLRSGLREA